MNEVILNNAYIIDVINEKHLTNASIYIKNGKIIWIKNSEDIKEQYENIKRYDASGCTILPGMINVHVHLCLTGHPNDINVKDKEAVTTIKAIENSIKTLHEGVTTVRDCGCTNSVAIELSKEENFNLINLPRIIATGRAIVMTGGHGHKSIGKEVDGVDEVRKAAREEIKYGAKALKVMATGGVLSPGTEIAAPELEEFEMKAVVNEARKKELTVAAHAIGSEGILAAVKAGVDSIEHGSYITEEAIEIMKEKGIFHIPTLTAYESIVKNTDVGDLDKSSVEKANQAYESNLNSFKASIKAKVNYATGTDAGTPFNPHGNIYQELELMTECGTSPFEALQAATISGARLLKLEDEIGSVCPNKYADLIVVRGNPLEDLKHVKNIKAVMKNGEFVYQE